MSTDNLKDIQAPPLLREVKSWLVWRLEEQPGGAKPRKVPYYINGSKRRGVNGSPEDVAQLTDFESAKAYASANGFTGIGFAFLEGCGVTGLDFDNCIIDGTMNRTVAEVTEGTYTEMSPSGNGVHAFVKGNLGDRKSPTTPDQFGFELFNTKIWLTYTGRSMADMDEYGVNEPNEALIQLIDKRFGKETPKLDFTSQLVPERTGVGMEILSAALNAHPIDLPYDAWLLTGMAIHHETEGSEEGFVLWDSWSANSPKYGSEEYGRYRWESFGANKTARPVTARSLIKMANQYGAGIKVPKKKEPAYDFSPIPFDPVPKHPGAPSHFNIHSDATFRANSTPSSWLIKGFLPKASLAVLYGESGSGKSFVALDMCASICRGVDWNGHKIRAKRNRVLYVIAEGVGGFKARLDAYCVEKGIENIGLDIISDVVPNLADGESVGRLIQDITNMPPYDLIVMDTFAQVTAGSNENSGEDMGRVLSYCRRLNLSTDAMVLLIHHSGKDASKGVRGHSGIHAACDAVFEVARAEESRSIKIVKQKDGTDGTMFGFNLGTVYLGDDEDGDDITSCIVTYHQYVKPAAKIESNVLSSVHQAIFDVLSTYTPGSWVKESDIATDAAEVLPELEDSVRDTRKQKVQTALRRGIKFVESNGAGSIRLI